MGARAGEGFTGEGACGPVDSHGQAAAQIAELWQHKVRVSMVKGRSVSSRL